MVNVQTKPKRESRFSLLELLPLPVVAPAISLARYMSGKNNIYSKDLNGITRDAADIGLASQGLFTYMPALFATVALADHYIGNLM